MVTEQDDPVDKPAGYLALGQHIRALRAKGICPTCRDLEQGDVFVGQSVICDDDQVRVVLDQYPRSRGQTIVVWKPHHEDFTTLAPDETAVLFQRCTEVANAIKRSLGAEKVYLVTMCDGFPNHLHIQLLPRFAGEPTGSRRFVGARIPLKDGPELARRIREALDR
jgi:diadenosine tetraphosphate (Ap4A) HIT family hydrolase